MKTFIFLTAYGLADDLIRAYDTANFDGATWLIYLHSQRSNVIAACETLAAHPNVVYFPYGENRGMSKSINEAILYAQDNGGDVFMSINDDVQCPSARARGMAVVARDFAPNSAYVQPQGYTTRIGQFEPLGFSCCAWNMKAFERVGLFDEYFYPFYFMDADWKRRALLLDLKPVTVVMPDVIHTGSKTITDVPGEAEWLAGAFDNTLSYYLAKWGGNQKQERYLTPFNEPSLDLMIDAAERHDPYPDHRPAFLGGAHG